MENRRHIVEARRVVIKLGTKVLLSHHNDIDRGRIARLVDDIATLRKQGYEFIIVSSGAVGFGMSAAGVARRPERLNKLQALAAIGQTLLMQDWHQIFSTRGIKVGQILLTYLVLQDRKRYLHARDCLNSLLEFGAIPIVNENDSVSVEELNFGDNDALSAITASLVDADLLVLFTDTDGVFDKNPNAARDAKRLSHIDEIDNDMLDAIEDKNNGLSLGGMRSKLKAARMSQESGTAVVIADGLDPKLMEIMKGEEVGTFIRPKETRINAKKKWIFFNTKTQGKIFVDDGAAAAILERCRSLLASGIVRVEGDFSYGTVVGVCTGDGTLIARGVSHYSSADIDSIKGQKTEEIRAIVGANYSDEVIDRNDLILV